MQLKVCLLVKPCKKCVLLYYLWHFCGIWNHFLAVLLEHIQGSDKPSILDLNPRIRMFLLKYPQAENPMTFTSADCYFRSARHPACYLDVVWIVSDALILQKFLDEVGKLPARRPLNVMLWQAGVGCKWACVTLQSSYSICFSRCLCAFACVYTQVSQQMIGNMYELILCAGVHHRRSNGNVSSLDDEAKRLLFTKWKSCAVNHLLQFFFLHVFQPSSNLMPGI